MARTWKPLALHFNEIKRPVSTSIRNSNGSRTPDKRLFLPSLERVGQGSSALFLATNKAPEPAPRLSDCRTADTETITFKTIALDLPWGIAQKLHFQHARPVRTKLFQIDLHLRKCRRALSRLPFSTSRGQKSSADESTALPRPPPPQRLQHQPR